MPRQIPHVDTFEYMLAHPHDHNAGAIVCEPVPAHHRVKMEVWHCAAYLDQQECLSVFLSLYDAMMKQWPEMGVEVKLHAQ